jgi:RNA-binding protein YlmH
VPAMSFHTYFVLLRARRVPRQHKQTEQNIQMNFAGREMSSRSVGVLFVYMSTRSDLPLQILNIIYPSRFCHLSNDYVNLLKAPIVQDWLNALVCYRVSF